MSACRDNVTESHAADCVECQQRFETDIDREIAEADAARKGRWSRREQGWRLTGSTGQDGIRRLRALPDAAAGQRIQRPRQIGFVYLVVPRRLQDRKGVA